MKTIMLAGQKGGGGKTTIAVHLAVAYMQAGRRVQLVDTDPQGSAAMLAGLREDGALSVISAQATDTRNVIARAEAEGFDYVIVDTPPHKTLALAETLRYGTLAVMPVQPSVIDYGAAGAMLDVILEANVQPVAVLNNDFGHTKDALDTRRALEETGLTVVDTELRHLVAYRRSLGYGQGVTEYEPKGRAAMEIRSLRRELDEIIAELHHEDEAK